VHIRWNIPYPPDTLHAMQKA